MALCYNRAMIFALAIYAPPSSAMSFRAWRFAQTLLQQGHQLHRVFFYHDGGYQGNKLVQTPQGEMDLAQQWQQLQSEYNLDIVVCIAAALKRGIVDATEASRYEKKIDNLHPGMRLGGLGELIDSSAHAERLVTFGG